MPPVPTASALAHGRQLLRLRWEHGWTLEEEAKRSGVSPSAIAEIEAGRRPRLETLSKLADALGPEAFGDLLEGASPVLRARIERKLSRRQAAALIDINELTLRRAERRQRIRADVGLAIARFYGLSVLDVMPIPDEEQAVA